MSWDDGLTKEQKNAASHIGSHARLLAGPGTGKTLSLTKRVLYLIEERQVPASEILAVTFTRAATAQLKKRLKQELGEEAVLPHIATLHSFALTTILQYLKSTRLPQPIRIADDFEERWIIQEDLKSILKLKKVNEVARLMNLLSADWEQLTADLADWETRFPNPAFLGAWREHRSIYGYTLRSELVYQLKLAMIEEGLELYNPPQYILVDEYQDLNACDLAVIHSLVDVGAELFGTGDDDQSIYAFRYANPDGIRRFEKEYSPSTLLELAECKRCAGDILEFGLFIARQDPRRLEKDLHCSSSAKRGIVKILRFPTQAEEAASVALICKWLIETQETRPEEILILLRSDRHGQFSIPIRSSLEKIGLQAATVANPLKILNCPKNEQGKILISGRYFLCLLRLLVNRQDHLSWCTILMLRKNRLGPTILSNIYDITHTNNSTFTETIFSIKDGPGSLSRYGEVVKQEVEKIETLLDNEYPESAGSVFEFISDFAERIIEDETERSEVIKLFERIIDIAEPERLEDLLRALNVSLGDAEQEKEKGVINLMTMHQAKGLSSDAVIIVAAEDEYLPGRSEGQFKDDERRLLYVSITRARHFLFLTHCNYRMNTQRYSGRTSGDPRRSLCRFLSGGPMLSEDGLVYCNNLE